MSDNPSSTSSNLKSGAFLARRYHLLRQLRQGAFHTIYLAKDQDAGEREVQLTILSEKVTNNPALLARLARELRAAMLIQSPYVLQCLDFDCLCDTPYVVHEHIAGATLNSLVGQSRALAIAEAVNITREILRGLQALHAVKITHGGISPETVLISDKGQVKLLLCGFSPFFQFIRDYSDASTSSLFLNTAPEVFEEGRVTVRSDIYATGLITYQLIVGVHPHQDLPLSDLKVTKGNSNPTPPHQCTADCPDNISAAIMRACAAPEAIRYANTIEMLEIFDQFTPSGQEIPEGSPPLQGFSKLQILDLPFIWLSTLLPLPARSNLSGLERLMRRAQTIPALFRVLCGVTICASGFALVFLISFFNPTTEPPPAETYAPSEPLPEPTKESRYPQYLLGDLAELDGKILFTAGKEGKRSILLLDLKAKELQPVIDDDSDNFDLTVAPDNHTVAFVRAKNGNSELYLLNLQDPTQFQKIPKSAGFQAPSFSPDGTLLAVSRETKKQASKDNGSEIYQLNIINGESKALTSLGGKNFAQTWNPITNQIAFVTDRFWPGSDVCIWDVERAAENCIRSGHAHYVRPSWDRSGKRLVDIYSLDNRSKIEVYDMTSGKVESTDYELGNVSDPVFSPDSGSILVIRVEPVTQRTSLLIMSDRGPERQVLLAPDLIRGPRWIR